MVIVAALLGCWTSSLATAQESQAAAGDPTEILCTVDGQPLYRGELNLLLAEQLAGKPLESASAQLRQAIALTLVRRYLALRTLDELGGDALAAQVKQETLKAAKQAERRGDSLQQLAEQAGSDLRSLGRDLKWKFSWSQYLRSRMTDENLERFFLANRAKYDGSRFRVSHIFFDLPATDRESLARTRENIQRLAKQIAAADDPATAFAAAAREQSQAASADQQGDLGWVGTQGDLPPVVMEQVIQAKPGQLAGPVQSPLGLHLLFVHERQGGSKTMSEMSDQASLRRDAADALFTALIRRQQNARVEWKNRELAPPNTVPIIP